MPSSFAAKICSIIARCIPGRVRIGRIRRIQHLVRDDESIAGLDHRVRRRRAENVHRTEEIAFEDVGPASDGLLRQTIFSTRTLIGRVLRIYAIHHFANVPHRRHIDLTVAMFFNLASAHREFRSRNIS